MEIEAEIPKTIDEMRGVVADWISDRPTLKHTIESLQKLMYSEVEELNQAVIDGESTDRIASEAGDVFFSLLAIETITGPKYSEQFASISKFCEESGTTLSELFDKTWQKNSINYVTVLFNEMTPFINPKDAISCLRIIRHATEDDPRTLNEFWQHTEYIVFYDTPFLDGWVATGKLRSTIKSRLNSINKSQGRGVDTKTKKETKRLLEIGEWSMIPYNIPNNRYNWHSW